MPFDAALPRMLDDRILLNISGKIVRISILKQSNLRKNFGIKNNSLVFDINALKQFFQCRNGKPFCAFNNINVR